MNGINNLSGSAAQGKDPIFPTHLRAIAKIVKFYDVLDVLVFVATLLMFRSLLRVSHIVDSSHTLLRSDVVFNDSGCVLLVRSSKTLKAGKGDLLIPINWGKDDSICAVRYLKMLLRMFPRPPSAPLFSSNGVTKFTYSMSMEILIRNDMCWHDFWKEDITVDGLWEVMYNIFLRSLNALCPLVNKLVQTDKPDWVTKDVKDAIGEKNQLYNTAKTTCTDKDWAAFRVKKKATSKLISDSKCKVMRKRLQDTKGNPKKFWRYMNHDILGKGERGGIEVIYDDNGKLLTGLAAAEFANKLYADMGKANVNKCNWTEKTMNMNRADSEFSFKFVELLEVHQLVMGIDIHKPSGVDDISTKVLKDCLLICEFELTYLFNVSLHNMLFPSQWKRSIITPIYKCGDKLKIDNWRPINNLCVPGKLLEKCVYRQVEEYMEKNKYMCTNQHGFRKGRGTDTAVMELCRKLFRDINDNNISSVLFLDYSKAFNTVDHSILLRKLNMYGFAPNVCKWFKDYFGERTQCTKIGPVLSPGVPIEHGVYQGSPLGPLMFIIYINDLVRITDSTFCNMYADDTVIVSSNMDVNEAVVESWDLFSKVSDWCEINKIKVRGLPLSTYAPRGGGVTSLLYISIAYYMQKGGEGVQIACKIAYVLNGRPLNRKKTKHMILGRNKELGALADVVID